MVVIVASRCRRCGAADEEVLTEEEFTALVEAETGAPGDWVAAWLG